MQSPEQISASIDYQIQSATKVTKGLKNDRMVVVTETQFRKHGEKYYGFHFQKIGEVKLDQMLNRHDVSLTERVVALVYKDGNVEKI